MCTPPEPLREANNTEGAVEVQGSTGKDDEEDGWLKNESCDKCDVELPTETAAS